MNRSCQDIIGESRARLLNAAELMDDGKFAESVVESARSSELALEAMLLSQDIESPGTGCGIKLETFGQHSKVDVSSWLDHCCRRIDLHKVFYSGCGKEESEKIFDEEYAMEIINYVREVLKFAQRNLFREESGDRP